MSLALILRSINALLGGWLLVAIIFVVLSEYRHGNRDSGQYLRFLGLAMYAVNSGLALADLRYYPVTWHTWLAGVSAVVSALGVLAIRHTQKIRRVT